MTPPRQPKGLPVGGQFAPTHRSAAEVTLGEDPWGAGPDEPGCPFTGCHGGQHCLEHSPDDRLVARVLQTVADAVHTADTSPEYVDYEELIGDRLGVDIRDFGDEITHPLIHALATGDAGTAYRTGGYLADLAEREQRWRKHPTWCEPALAIEREDDYYGPVTRGEKYDPDRPLRDVAKDVRADIKAAVAAGYLPDLEYTVGTQSKSRAIDVRACGMDHLLARKGSDRYPEIQEVSGVARQLEQRLESILASYNRTQTASQVDYWNHAFYARATVFSDVEDRYRKASETEFGAMAKVRKGMMGLDELRRIQAKHDAARRAQQRAKAQVRQQWNVWNGDQAVWGARQIEISSMSSMSIN